MLQHTVLMIILLCIFLPTAIIANDKFEQIQCGSNIASQIIGSVSHDYLLNLSILSPQDNNLTLLDIEIIASPSIPIEIYFTNATIYKSCVKQCYVNQIATHQDYIIRLNKYLQDKQIINYTLSISCSKPYITTSIYTSNIVSTFAQITEFDYSVSFNQQLTFQNRGNILSFGVSILIVLVFITLGLFQHYNSDRPELLFLARKSNAPYYLCSIATLLFSIIMCSTRYTAANL
eukprot:438680_1